MRTRSCNVVRATLVACGTIGLLTSLASAQQLSPASSNKGAEAKKLQASKLAPPSVGTTRTPATVKNPVQHIEHAAGGGAVRGPGAATDDCLSAPTVNEGLHAFDTTTFTNDYPASCGASDTAPDGWWKYVATGDGTAVVTTCGNATMDTVLTAVAGCGGGELACNDDSCFPQSTISFPVTTGGEYLIRISGFAGGTGAGSIDISIPPPATCGDCPPAANVFENEADCGIAGGVDSTNGGCNSVPEVFTPIAVGDTACGTGAFDGAFRDTDWYEFTLLAGTEVTWSATAEFDVLIGFIASPCPQGAFIAGTAFVAGACTPVTSTVCLPAGTYYAFIAPQFTATFACGTGSGNRYVASLTGIACDASGPANDECDAAIALTLDTPALGDNTFANTSTVLSDAICGPFLGSGGASDVFYSFTPAASGDYLVNTCGSALDTVISVHTACPSTEVDLLACNDDFCGVQSQVLVTMNAAQTYFIRVASYGGGPTGAFQVLVTVPPPPADCAVCPPPGPNTVDEAEFDCGIAGGVDTVNGGCNSVPEVFTPISVGQTACGTGAFDGAFRDTDWYEFTLGSDTQVTWDVNAEFDVLIGFIASPCPQGAFIGGTAFTSTACVPVSSSVCLPAGTYYAFVAPQFTTPFLCGAGAGNRYTAALSGVSCTPPAPPADECPGAVITAPSTTNGSTAGLTGTDITSCTFGDTIDGWYTLTPPVTGLYTIDMCGSSFDTGLSVWAECPPATELACNDDSCGLQSSVTVNLTAGETYHIRVSGYNGQSGTFVLNVSNPPAAPTGACCAGANCTIGTLAACQILGGVYQGDNSSCTAGTFTSNPNLAIPDASCPTTVGDSQSIASFTISTVAVRVQIPAHTWIGDLSIWISNGANTVQLWNSQCGSNDGLDVTFQDGAPAVICGTPTAGTYAPFQPLSVFNGLDASGSWTLTACDAANGDIGTITSWSLIFTSGSLPSVCGGGFCDADWCQDGSVNVPDIFCFLEDWFANDPHAINFGGTPGVPAIFAFLTEWFATPQGPCTP